MSVDHDTKDCTRLPVVAYECLANSTTVHLVYEVDGDDPVPLCRLTDAQALFVELRASHIDELARAGEQVMAQAQTISDLRSHIRTDNSETLVNALAEIERLTAALQRVDEHYALKLQAAPAERGDTNFVASTGEYRNPLYEGQFDDETPEQAAHRLHWSRTAMEVQSARLNPAPATADSDVREVK